MGFNIIFCFFYFIILVFKITFKILNPIAFIFKNFFEITYVETENQQAMFFTLGRGRGGNVYVYALKIKQFVFSSEIIATGNAEIDDQIRDYYPRTKLSLNTGSGLFLNDEIVRRFGVLFRAGEVTRAGVGEKVVDSSDIINTLRGSGITSVGYAITDVMSKSFKQRRGLLGTLKDTLIKREGTEQVLLGDDKSAKIIGLVRRAMLGRLTLPCDYSSAQRALVLIAGPPDELDRKGVEKAKTWVEENIAGVEVRGGDYPLDSNYVAAVVVLATIQNAPRIKELMTSAKETKEDVLKIKDKKPTAMFDEGIEPLFVTREVPIDEAMAALDQAVLPGEKRWLRQRRPQPTLSPLRLSLCDSRAGTEFLWQYCALVLAATANH
jgi:hypothetical protein